MSDGTGLKLVTFDPTSARHVLAKLHREIERIDSAPGDVHVGDHISNAFSTAWQLHQWVWDAIHNEPRLRAAVLKYRGLEEAGVQDSTTFGAALAGRFVPLKICRVIANTPKHIRVVLAEDSKLSDADGESFSSESDESRMLNLSPQRWVAAIVVMDRTVAATRLLREIEEYWVTLIHECGIEQLR